MRQARIPGAVGLSPRSMRGWLLTDEAGGAARGSWPSCIKPTTIVRSCAARTFPATTIHRRIVPCEARRWRRRHASGRARPARGTTHDRVRAWRARMVAGETVAARPRRRAGCAIGRGARSWRDVCRGWSAARPGRRACDRIWLFEQAARHRAARDLDTSQENRALACSAASWRLRTCFVSNDSGAMHCRIGVGRAGRRVRSVRLTNARRGRSVPARSSALPRDVLPAVSTQGLSDRSSLHETHHH